MSIQRLKRVIKKNRVLYGLLRILYIPYREVMLYKTKKGIVNESIVEIQKRNSKKPTIYFFGVPIHKNLGDLAQTYCIKRYFDKYWYDYEYVMLKSYSAYSARFIKALKGKIRDDDMIFFQSGYCTTDYHLDHTMHKIIVKKILNNKIVFFPQTVKFNSAWEKNKTSHCFDSNKNVIFLARDDVSFRMAVEMFPNLVVKCFPDIVTTLIGSEENNEKQKGVLLCIRNDYEKLYSQTDINYLIRKLSANISCVDTTDTSFEEFDYEYVLENLEKVVFDKINMMKKYSVVITDRYHGTIFSLIANVPVIVLATNDHKVKTGVDWFKNIYEDVHVAETIDDAIGLVNEIIKKNDKINNKPYFEEHYYSKLRPIIEAL